MPALTLTRRRLGTSVTAAILAAVLALPAQAEELKKVRFAYLLSDTLLSVFRAKDQGYFAAEGLDVDLIPVQGGPAVIAALASGEADIGYAAPVPPLNARAQGVPVKLFLTLGHEADPDRKYVWLVASKASGVTSLADVAGKKIAINGNGTGCELAWRDHLAAAGQPYDESRVVVLPFPQQEAALEQGTIDVGCAIQPFYASIEANPEIGAKVIARGLLADEKEPVISDSVIGTDAWLSENEATAKAFAHAVVKARDELLANRALVEEAAVKYLDLTPELAKTLDYSVLKPEVDVKPGEVQRILDALVKAGIIKTPLKAEDVSIDLKL